MTDLEYKESIYDILKNLHGLNPLKELFWGELNYKRVNEPLSRHGWTDTAATALAEDPILFASDGEGNDFHIIYSRLASDRLLLGLERPVVTRLLRDHPYVLFIFSNSDQDRWHFLNVKYDQETHKRRLFRRITIGPEERLRTATERLQLLDLRKIKKDSSGLSPLIIQEKHDEAFDVEAVTKDFFKVFAKLYHKVVEDISEVHGLEKEAGKLAQLLLDRMLFLYFIQRKGWLDQKPDYLYSRFQARWRKDPKGYSYYSNDLYPLFLCLSDAYTQMDLVGAVPFLNGGLFEEGSPKSQADLLAEARLKIKNLTFKAIFDELLERFNFTVTEDTPLDVEVAIDPEMLGKIFENLILQLEKDPDKDLRKLTGSYYTPRPIVYFMCQEALKEYLVTQLADDDKAKTEITPKKIEQLLALPPADQLDDEQANTLMELFTGAEAKALRQAIVDCRICDPAVGSGAFLVGMLHEMVAAITRLDLHLHGKEILQQRNYNYNLKKQIIESCLYGVDIQEQAVRLCELRLWLSLVVDYQIDPDKPFAQAIREIPSLPNLSYRIMQGDSLLERLFGHVVKLDEMAKDAKTKQLIESVQADKLAYFLEGKNTEKRRLELKILAKQADLAERLIEAKQRSRIQHNLGLFEESDRDRNLREVREAQDKLLNNLKAKINTTKAELERLARQKGNVNRGDLDTLRRKYFQTGDFPTFMWHVDFAEVFTTKGGFDVVIGNPPYLSARRFKDQKTDLSKNYITPYGSYDIYVVFMELGIKILNNTGVICIITSNKYLLADYGVKLRSFLRNYSKIQKIIDLADCTRVFDALISPAITLTSPGCTQADDKIQVAVLKGHQFLDIDDKYFKEMSFSNLQKNNKSPFDIYIKSDSSAIISKIEEDAVPLSSLGILRTGIMGFDYWAMKPYIKDLDIVSNSNIVRVVTNSHIEPFHFLWGKKIRLYNTKYYNPRLNLKSEVLNNNTRDFFRMKKVIMRGVAKHTTAAWDRIGNALLVAVHGFAPEKTNGFYITGLINSDLFNWLHRIKFYSARIPKGSLRYPISFWKDIPIKTKPEELISEISDLTKAITNSEGNKFRELYSQLNSKILKLYGVSKKDIGVNE